MSTQKQIDRLIAQRASEWVEILKTAGPAEHEAFVDWLRESRRHVAEFLTMVALEREMAGVGLRDAVDRPALLARLSPGISRLEPADPNRLRQSRHMSARRSRRWALAAAAASVAVAAAVYLGLPDRPSEQLVSRNGEQRAVELADGSVVQLNARSKVTTRLTRAARELELVQGEALFKVAHDARRPFRVRTGAVLVEALGTEFNINVQSGATVISVVDGKVRVSSFGDNGKSARPITLEGGEEVRIGGSGEVERTGSADVAGAIAWRQKRLVFQKTPLEEVVRQFNSHNAEPKLRLEGVEPGSRHYSATFDVDDPESFGDYLAREPDLMLERRGEDIVIRMR